MSDNVADVLEALREEMSELREEVAELRSDGRDSEQLLTREEAADRLRISTSTLDDMADLGEIQPTRIRGRVLYHPSTVEAYVRQHTG